MSTAIFACLALGITISAFAIKSGMLKAASIIFWLVLGFLLYNMTWPTGNTFYSYAAILACLAMTIVMVAASIMHYLTWSKERRTYAPTDEEQQASYANQVRKITKKKDSWS